MERVNEREPAVRLFGADAGFHRPIGGAVGLLDLRLHKVKRLQLRARQRMEREHQPGVLLDLGAAHDEALAGAAGEERNARVDAEDFKNLFCVRKKLRRHEDEPERNVRRGEPPAQLFGPSLKPGFVEAALPVRDNGCFRVHALKLAGRISKATRVAAHLNEWCVRQDLTFSSPSLV